MRLMVRYLFMLLCLSRPLNMGVSAGEHQLADGQVLTGTFVQERHLKGFKQPIRSSGKYLITASDGLVWQTLKPFPVTLVITRREVVQMQNGEVVGRQALNGQDGASHLVEILSGVLTGRMRGDKGLELGEREGEHTNWRQDIRFSGAASAARIERIELHGGEFVRQAEIFRRGGDRDFLTFSDQSIGAESDADLAALRSVDGEAPAR